jgi:hypothetical protein
MTVDLSPAAIYARLRLASDLRDLCQAIANRLPPDAMEQRHSEDEEEKKDNII